MTPAVLALWVLSPWILWALYVLVMGIYRAHLAKKLTPTLYLVALPWVALGLVADVLVNIFVASVVFLEPPWEWLVTDRLQRHLAASYGWRARLARWICTHLLDVFDPSGRHC